MSCRLRIIVRRGTIPALVRTSSIGKAAIHAEAVGRARRSDVCGVVVAIGARSSEATAGDRRGEPGYHQVGMIFPLSRVGRTLTNWNPSIAPSARAIWI